MDTAVIYAGVSKFEHDDDSNTLLGQFVCGDKVSDLYLEHKCVVKGFDGCIVERYGDEPQENRSFPFDVMHLLPDSDPLKVGYNFAKATRLLK